MTWWGVFMTVVIVVVVLCLVGAALADRRARARGYRSPTDLARSLRRSRGELRNARAEDLFRRRRPG